MEAVIVLGVILLTQIVKKYIYPKFGSFGVNVFAFLLALIGAVIYLYVYSIPTWQVIIERALQTLVYAVAVYEIILKKIGFSTAPAQID